MNNGEDIHENDLKGSPLSFPKLSCWSGTLIPEKYRIYANEELTLGIAYLFNLVNYPKTGLKSFLLANEYLLKITAFLEKEYNAEIAELIELALGKGNDVLEVDKSWLTQDLMLFYVRMIQSHTPSYFWVNQGNNFDKEADEGYIWAPNSKTHQYHRLKELREGDFIIHYANGIKATSTVTKEFIATQNAEGVVGNKVEVGYNFLDKEKSIEEIQNLFKNSKDVLPKQNSPFNRKLELNTGFLYNFNKQAFDLLFETGTNGEFETQKKSMKKYIALNTILYGPPGTGKTYHLNTLKEEFIDKEAGVNEEEVIKEIADNNSWWKIIAALLYLKDEMKVPDITQEPIIKAKHNTDKPTKANQIIWSQLQLHTKPDNPHVNHVRRHDPAIFWKDENSNWTVDKDLLEKELVDIVALAQEIKEIGSKKQEPKEIHHYDFITFHQSFTYEDFLEGIKPVLEDPSLEEKENQEISYHIEKGIFYRCCLRALNLAGYKSFTECHNDSYENRKSRFKNAKPYAIFIDEINRGNVSSIFGELITLIEKDKRISKEQEIWVNLPYDKNIKFGVPPNLYLIGTMNTADRSVEALDTALRRRFSFQEIEPNPQLLYSHILLWRLWLLGWDLPWEDKEWNQQVESLLNILGGEIINEEKYYELEYVEWVEGFNRNVFDKSVLFNGIKFDKLLISLNERIELLLDKDHRIGHAYFFSLIGANDCEQELKYIFYNKIIPLLEEYFYGDYSKIGLILGEDFVKPKPGKSIHFANFKTEDIDVYKDKSLYEIIDFRKTGGDFIAAVKNIYTPTSIHAQLVNE